MTKYLGRSDRDSAGDSLDRRYYAVDGKLIEEHWGRRDEVSPEKAIAYLESEAAHAESLANSSPALAYCMEGASNARQTIQKIREHFALDEAA